MYYRCRIKDAEDGPVRGDAIFIPKEVEDLRMESHAGNLAKIIGDYSSEVRRKKRWLSHKVERIKSLLNPVLPKLPNAESSRKVSFLEDFRSCEDPGILFEVVHFISPDVPNRNILTFNCFGCEQYKTDSKWTIRTSIGKQIYESLVTFIQLNDTREFRDVINMGFGKNFTICVNSSKQALLELYVRTIDNEEHKKLESSILSKLKNWFESCAKDCNVVSLVVKIYSKNESQRTVLYGDPYLTETVYNLKFLISGFYLCSWHPSGMKLFSDTLLELADLNNKSGVVQIGCISAVPTLLMAKTCKKLAVIDYDENVGKFLSTNAEKNNIKNILHIAVHIRELCMQRAAEFLDLNFRPCRTVCAVIHKFDDTGADQNFLKKLQKCYKINKIIFVLPLKNVELLERLVSCCEKDNEEDDGFVVTRAIPVDISPFQTDMQILYLLERESELCAYVKVEKSLESLPQTKDNVPVNEVKLEKTEKSKLKELSAIKQAELISSVLTPLLPKLVKDREPNRVFHLEKLRLCPLTETLSDVLEVHTGIDLSTQELEMKYTTSIHGKSVPVIFINSNAIRRVYENLIEYIRRKNIPLYNPNTGLGFWKKVIIRMNHGGTIMMIIEYNQEYLKKSNLYFPVDNALKAFAMSLESKGLKVISLMTKAYYSGTKCSTKYLLGPNGLFEAVDGLIINVSDRPYTLVNQYAIVELSRSIADVAHLDNSCTVLQIGAGYDAVTLYLSKLCKQFYMICDKLTLGNQTSVNALSNKMTNFSFYSKGMPKKGVYELLPDVLTELTEEKNICVLLYEFPEEPDDGIQEILMAKNVKKILFMAEVDIETQAKKLVAFCNGQSPFIITKAIPIDISPNSENVKMIYLLERELLVSNLVEDNKELSVVSVTNLLKERIGFSLENATYFAPKTDGLSSGNTKSSNNLNHIPEKSIKSLPLNSTNLPNDSNDIPEKNIELLSTNKSGQEKFTIDKVFEKTAIFKKPVMQVKPKQIIVKPIQIVSRFNIPVEGSSSTTADVQGAWSNPSAQGKPFKSDKKVQRDKKKILEYIQKSNKKANSSDKKKMAANIHDDWCTGLDLEDNFHKQVAKLVHEKPVETTTDYESQLTVKQMYAMAQAKCLSDVLEPILPVIVIDRSPELIFHMQDIKPCPFIKSRSNGFQAITGIDDNSNTPEMKFEFYSPYKSIPMRPFNSKTIESTYKHLMNVISKSELELFNPLSRKGFWKKITIKINNVREKFIVIEAFSSTKNVAKKLSLKAMEEIQSYFKSEARRFDTGPIMLKVKCNSNLLSYRMIFWKSYMKDEINGFKVKVCDDLNLWIHNPTGLVVLSNAIMELGQLKKTSVVVQIGCYDGITFMNLSKQCRKVVMIHDDPHCTVEHQFVSNANENKIKNFSIRQVQNKEDIQMVLDRSSLKSLSDIYVVIYNYAFTSDCQSILLRSSSNIKKIICVSDSRNPQELKSVFMLCKENNLQRAFMSDSTHKAFVITKAAAVDLSPYEDNVKMLYLLERVNDLQGHTESNTNYNESKVSEFEGIKTLQRKAPKSSDRKSDRETKKMLSVLKLCEGRKPSVISSSEFKESQKMITDYERYKDNDTLLCSSRKDKRNHNREVDWNRNVKEMDDFDIPGIHILDEEELEQVRNNSKGNQIRNVHNKDLSSLSTAAIQKAVEGQEVGKIAENLIKSRLDGEKVNTVAKNLIKIGLLLANKAATATAEEIQIHETEESNECDNKIKPHSEMTGKDDNDPSEMSYKLKRREVFRSVKSISDALKTALPSLDARGNFGLVFHLNDLRPCPMTKTQCDILQAFSGIDPNSGKVDMIPQGRNSGIQSVDTYSDTVRYLYDKILRFMKNSLYEMYNPENDTGFWDSICIIVNDHGESMIVVKGFVSAHVSGMEERTTELSARLRNCFLEDAANNCVVSLVFRICYTNMTNVKVLIGEDYLNYNIGTLKIQMFENSTFFPNPYGLELLSNTLVEIANLNQSYRVLQLGSEFDLLSIKLAKECQKIFVLDEDKNVGQHLLTNMSRNNISNINFITEDGNNQFLHVLEYDIRSSEDVCVILFGNLQCVSGDTYEALMRDLRVKKIVLVAEELDSSDVKILISLCKAVFYCSDPFIIKEVVPVEMCPYSTCVKMVYLLIRKSESTSQTIPAIPCPEVISKRVIDINHLGENRSLFKGSFSNEIRTATKATESSTGHFSSEIYFASRHDLQGDKYATVEKAKHMIQEQLPYSSLHGLTEERKKGLARTDWEENICITQRTPYKNVLPDAKIPATKTNELLNLDPDFILQKKIINAVYRGGQKTTQQLREIVHWKEQWVSLHTKSLSESLKDVLPVLVRDPSKGLVFYQGDMISCPVEDPPYCSKFEVFSGLDRNTGHLTMCYGVYPDGSLIHVTYFHSYVFQCIYEKVMEFIGASGYRLFNPNDESGLWKNIVITMNQFRESMLLVTGQALKSNSLNFKTRLESLYIMLKQYLSSNEVKDTHLVSAVIHVKFASEDVTIPVIGDGTMEYQIHSMNVKVHALTLPWPSIHIVKELSKTIVKVANLDKTWSVIQIGCGYVLEALYLAQACKKVLVFDSSVEQGNCITKSAERSGIDMVCLPEKLLNARFSQIFKTDLASCKNICLVINKCDERFFNVWLRHVPEIKQIIWITKAGATEVFRTLCHLCDKNDDKKDPFLILKVTPVDLSVYENDIDMIYHLTRQSRTPHLQSNRTYFEEQCKKLCGMSDNNVTQTKDLFDKPSLPFSHTSSVQSTCQSIHQDGTGIVSLKRGHEFVASDDLERHVKSQKYDGYENNEKSDAGLIISGYNVANKFIPSVRSAENQINYQSSFKNIHSPSLTRQSSEYSDGQKEFGQNIFLSQCNREAEHFKHPSTFVKEHPESGNSGEQRDTTSLIDHMGKRNDFITFHYDHSTQSCRGSLSGVNVSDTRLQNESFQHISNIPESRDSSSYGSPFGSDTDLRTNIEVLQYGNYNSDRESQWRTPQNIRSFKCEEQNVESNIARQPFTDTWRRRRHFPDNNKKY